MINNRTVGAGIVLALMISFGVYWRSHHVSLPPESEMPQILKEAAGTAPVPASDTPGRKAIRDSFKSLLEENKSYQAEAERYFLRGHLNDLMYPNSFVNSGQRQEILAELQELKALDQRHLTAIQQFPEVFKANLTAAGASAGNVAAFDRGMRKEISGGALDEVSHAMDLDMKWIDATLELYQYADQNQSHISTRYTQVQFDSDELRAHFVYLSGKAGELGDERDKATAAFEGRQKLNRRRIGLTSQDYGQKQ
jgi:hypothetical protein